MEIRKEITCEIASLYAGLSVAASLFVSFARVKQWSERVVRAKPSLARPAPLFVFAFSYFKDFRFSGAGTSAEASCGSSRSL